MRRIKGIILAEGLLMVAFSGIAAASASAALPEFSTAKASFEVTPTSEPFFNEGSGVWTYPRATGSGALISGSKEVSGVSLTLDEGLGFACYNTKEDSSVWKPLHGHLGYINKAKTEVGLLLEPSTQPIVECETHGYGPQEYRGSVIGRVTPVNTPTKELTVTFNQDAGNQEFRRFEGEEALHSLEVSKCECHMGMELKLQLSTFKANEKAVSMEVKA